MGELLKITDVFDIEGLQKIQDAFADATGFATVTVDYQGNPITKYSKFTKFCNCIRKDINCMEFCCHSDAFGGIESARTGKPYIYVCHGGLVDMAVPIMINGKYLGAILSGQVRISKAEMEKLPAGPIMEELEISNQEAMIKLRNETNITTLDKVVAGAELLYSMANYLVEKEMIAVMKVELQKKNMELLEEVKYRSEIEAALKVTELKALQAQINPHFLFNVLNTIGRLALLENADKTQEMLYAFSDMMRYTLKKESNDYVLLSEELEHVNNYLSIQKVRLGKRLEYSIDIQVGIENVQCPFMSIQPFVENAINHAIEPDVNGGTISVTAKAEGDDAVISIKDSGKGIPQNIVNAILAGTYKVSDEKRTGIGISNTNKRLKYYFGESYGIQYNRLPNKGTEVVVRLPIQKLNERALNA